jgi:antitoxin component YwqK of YwqJK toxin-antitoxin module
MRSTLTKSIIVSLIAACISCSDNKKQELLKNHFQNSEIKNFKIKPELSVYLQLMSKKTKTSITSAGYECEFLENTDSIINYFSLEINQDSIDTNHKDLSKEKILENIAIDIKPMVENYNLFQGVSIVLTSKKQLTENVGTGMEIIYKQPLSNILNNSKYKYEFIGDTLSLEDYYYNGIQAYSGKILNNNREGYWVYWYPNGKKKKEGMFVNDEKMGEWKYWNENGEIQK